MATRGESGRRTPAEPVRITTAAADPAEERSHRQRNYLISMAIRTLCVLGAVLVGPGWFRWVLVAGAVFLPYVAVVLANAQPSRDDGFSLRSGAGHRELGGPSRRRLG